MLNGEGKGKNNDDVRLSYSSSPSSSLPSLGKACKSSSISSCFLLVRVVMIGVSMVYSVIGELSKMKKGNK